MSEPGNSDWFSANQRYLMAAVDVVREALERHVARAESDSVEAPSAESSAALAAAGAELPSPAALDVLCSTFGLSDHDRDVLLLCAGMELDGAFAALCARAQGASDRPYPTFGLALAALPGASWATLSPAGPLRRWLLVEVGPGHATTSSPLRVDEPILHYLAGLSGPDDRLAGLGAPLPEAGPLVPSHGRLADEMTHIWSRTAGSARFPAFQLCGNEVAGKRAIAAEACARLRLRPWSVPAAALPVAPAELRTLIRLLNREALLAAGALVLDCDESEPGDAARDAAIQRLLADYRGPLFFTTRKRRPAHDRPVHTLDVAKPRRDEQRQIWRSLLGGESARVNGQVERLVAQFDLSAPAIEAACASAVARQAETESQADTAEGADGDLGAALWRGCRTQARPRLDDLTQRIRRRATWDQLVLPGEQSGVLREIVVHVRQQGTVYDAWGFRRHSSRGLGVSALFAGASGTGKTMAAEVVAGELDLDLYRIDLASVISKYIGETEKNLGRVFDAAEEGGAILLFDEADALFGKRSEIRDSHDRYANVEISYLLQRMESYRGLAILTTNMRQALDQAFLRRIRFIVEFPFPGPAERAEIWKRIFPPEMPRAGLEVDKLARLGIAGGSIRNVALNAAFLAAEAGVPVAMEHLLHAARNEFRKIQRSIPDKDVRDWR